MKRRLHVARSWLSVITVCCVLILATAINGVRADQFDQQIQNLETQNSSSQAQSDQLAAQANTYQAEINALQAQIDGLQAAIATNQQQSISLQQQITNAQNQLNQQKKVLGEDIKAMYLEGQTSTLEILASSNNLSDFVNKETYRSSVQDKIKTTVDTINALQVQLKSQQTKLQQLIGEQQTQNAQLSATQSQQNQMLAYTEGQKAAYDQQIQNNNTQIATLRAEQIAANRQLDSSGQIISSGSCGGGYPATAAGPDGNWGCNYPKDNTIDNFGMYNRECVSYTAWMVYSTYGSMPDWGGVGNAWEWAYSDWVDNATGARVSGPGPGISWHTADAQAAGIPTGTSPRVNSVAIFEGDSTDPFGHAMWVVGVSGNQIHVYSYNDEYDGNFYDHWVSAAGLTYIYFQ